MKRIICMLLALVSVMLCLSACGSGNPQDEALAKECAIQKAEDYYDEYFDGKSVSGGKYVGCTTEVSEVKYSGGKYIVTVALKIEGIEPTYGMSVYVTHNIKYTIKVSNGNAIVEKTEHLDTN